MTGFGAVVEHSYSYFFKWGGKINKLVVLKENVVSVEKCFVVGLRHTFGA